MPFNSPLDKIQQETIRDKFNSWEEFLKMSASEIDTNLPNILDIKLKYMDNRSIDKLNSRNLTIHSSNDCDSKLLYMIKLFYKCYEEDGKEELYLGFRKSSQIINSNFCNYLTSFEVEDNAIFGGDKPSFICAKIYSSKNNETIYEVNDTTITSLIRIYIALVIITLNSFNELNS